MELYILMQQSDTRYCTGSDAELFTDKPTAQAAMRRQFEDALEESGLDKDDLSGDDIIECGDSHAEISDGIDFQSWKITEYDLDVHIAVEVCGGMVSRVYSNADVSADVYDLDVSDFPDDGEQAEADRKKSELEQLIKIDGWKPVW